MKLVLNIHLVNLQANYLLDVILIFHVFKKSWLLIQEIKYYHTIIQNCISKDNIPFKYKVVVGFNIDNCYAYVNQFSDINGQNRNNSILEMVNILVRQLLTSSTRQDILENHIDFIKNLENEINEINEIKETYGVKITRLNIDNIIFDEELTRALAFSAETIIRGNAKIIAAKSDIEVSKLLAQSANEIKDNETAMKLREIEMINNAVKEKGTTIIFYPRDMNTSLIPLSTKDNN